MSNKKNIALLACGALMITIGHPGHNIDAKAAANSVKITVTGDQRCMESNGIADHATGRFPRQGNPNTISEQSIRLCVPANPTKGSTAKTLRGTVGFALNGIIMRPGTADWYDASSSRGHSRDSSSGWNLEGLGAAELLGMDENNAHVDNQGIYHYHGPSPAIMNAAQGTLVGYAADGHEIHYLGGSITTSWQLKSGTRPTEPFDAYDGMFEQDWHYVAGSGNLDECNGGVLNGKYVYFATDTFPFFPRCAYGDISSDFGLRGGELNAGNDQQDMNKQASDKPRRPRCENNSQRADGQRRGQGRDGQRGGRRSGEQFAQNRGNRRAPPQIAFAACVSKSEGNSCSFQSPRGQLNGTCFVMPDQQKACQPIR